jgi:hypothetical protein
MRSPRTGGASFLRMTARGPGRGDALASNGATECAPIHQILLRNDTSADLADDRHSSSITPSSDTVTRAVAPSTVTA